MTDPSPGDKAAARARARAARRAMPGDVREAADAALARAAHALVVGAGTIAAYAPMSGEPGGKHLLAAVAGAVRTVLLPVVTVDSDLDWAQYRGPGELVPAAGAPTIGAATGSAPVARRPTLPDLIEPVGPRLGPAAITQAELVLVPALAVDRFGVRLGRGAGCYDRALSRVHPGVPIVALLYDGELVEVLLAQAHDVPVTAVLTPSALHAIAQHPSGAIMT